MRQGLARSSSIDTETKKGSRTSRRRSASSWRRARLEQLEERAVMASFNIDPLAADGAVNSLRWAISQANTNAQSDTIIIPAGTFPITLTGTIEDLNARGDFDLKEKSMMGEFRLEDYQSFARSKKESDSKSAVALLDQANGWLAAGDQEKASQAFSNAVRSNQLDAASGEDAGIFRVAAREIPFDPEDRLMKGRALQEMLARLYSQVVSRVYLDSTTGKTVMLSLAYGEEQNKQSQVHLPEVCYPAQGFVDGRHGIVKTRQCIAGFPQPLWLCSSSCHRRVRSLRASRPHPCQKGSTGSRGGAERDSCVVQ
mgnify:CR=1 FL=1